MSGEKSWMRVCNNEQCRMLDLEEYPSREQAKGAQGEWETEPVAQWECYFCGHVGFDVVGRTAPMLPGDIGDVTITVPPG